MTCSVRTPDRRLADPEFTPASQGREAISLALPLLLEKGGWVGGWAGGCSHSSGWEAAVGPDSLVSCGITAASPLYSQATPVVPVRAFAPGRVACMP